MCQNGVLVRGVYGGGVRGSVPCRSVLCRRGGGKRGRRGFVPQNSGHTHLCHRLLHSVSHSAARSHSHSTTIPCVDEIHHVKTHLESTTCSLGSPPGASPPFISPVSSRVWEKKFQASEVRRGSKGLLAIANCIVLHSRRMARNENGMRRTFHTCVHTFVGEKGSPQLRSHSIM